MAYAYKEEIDTMGIFPKLIIGLVLIAIALFAGLLSTIFQALGFWGTVFLLWCLWLIPDIVRLLINGTNAFLRGGIVAIRASKNWLNFAAVFPISAAKQVFFGLFFALIIVGLFAQLFEALGS